MGHKHKKSLGQNFLKDQLLLQKIVNYIRPSPQDHIVEIGPGEGALSFKLAQSGCKLTLIEIDDRLITKLQESFYKYPQVKIIHADALTIDYQKLGMNRIVGNLPYNIASQLILKLIPLSRLDSLYFVIQKEMASRLCSGPRSKEYGRLTLMSNLYCKAELCFDLPPSAFDPPPKVFSTLVSLTPYICTLEDSQIEAFSKIVSSAFSQRRKQIGNSLKLFLNHQELNALCIDPKSRAENLSFNDFLKIADNLYH